MALLTKTGTCIHCGEAIGLRVYAAPYAADEHARAYGVELWTSGAGTFPGDQRFCEAHTLEDGYSTGDHEPAEVAR